MELQNHEAEGTLASNRYGKGKVMASDELARVSESGSSLILLVNSAECPVTILRRTTFSFVRDCYVFLRRPTEEHFEVTLTPREHPVDRAILTQLEEKFDAEMKDQILRDRLLKETGSVRQLVVGQALFAPHTRSDPFADDLDFLDDGDDFLDDPLGIAVPWEEKFADGEEQPGAEVEAGGAEPAPDDATGSVEEDGADPEAHSS